MYYLCIKWNSIERFMTVKEKKWNKWITRWFKTESDALKYFRETFDYIYHYKTGLITNYYVHKKNDKCNHGTTEDERWKN